MIKQQPMQNLRSRAQQLEIAKQRQAQNIAKAKAPSTKPPSNIGPVNPIGTRGDSPPPIMLPPTGPTKPGYEPPPTGPMPAPIPDTPPIGENTRLKKPAVDDRGVPIGAPQQPKPPQMEYLPGPDGTKIPIHVGNRGVTPLPGPGLIGMPEPTPEAIAAGKAIDARKAARNLGAVAPTPDQRNAQMQAMQLAAKQASSPVNPGGPSMGFGSGVSGGGLGIGPAPQIPMMRKGGQVKPKAYAKGGAVSGSSTVRGSGIAQRGVKKCKIY